LIKAIAFDTKKEFELEKADVEKLIEYIYENDEEAYLEVSSSTLRKAGALKDIKKGVLSIKVDNEDVMHELALEYLTKSAELIANFVGMNEEDAKKFEENTLELVWDYVYDGIEGEIVDINYDEEVVTVKFTASIYYGDKVLDKYVTDDNVDTILNFEVEYPFYYITKE